MIRSRPIRYYTSKPYQSAGRRQRPLPGVLLEARLRKVEDGGRHVGYGRECRAGQTKEAELSAAATRYWVWKPCECTVARDG
jgi:hypothetical protein